MAPRAGLSVETHMSDPGLSNTEYPKIVLASGQTIELRRVRLYEAEVVQEIAKLKASALKSMGGVSTGVGFWGSPTWALGGAAALGVIEGILSSAARKQGLQTLKVAQNKHQIMMQGATYFDARELDNPHIPYPQAWSATATSRQYIDLSSLNWLSKKSLLLQHNRSESDIENIHGAPFLVIATGKEYIHDGDDFVHIETEAGTLSIRWTQVAAYSPPKSPPPPSSS